MTSMAKDTYTVNTNRWEHGWELHIVGPGNYTGASQTHRLKSAEKMARDYIAHDREIAPDSFDVVINPVADNFLGELPKDAKEKT